MLLLKYFKKELEAISNSHLAATYDTNLRTLPALWSQIHTCQVLCLHLPRLQRCHTKKTLLTQRNKHTYKHLSKYSQPFLWWSTPRYTMSPEPLSGLLIHTHTQSVGERDTLRGRSRRGQRRDPPVRGPQLPTVYSTFCTWAMERYRLCVTISSQKTVNLWTKP